jgi:hypothetical protein
MSPSSLGSARCLFHASFFRDLFFDPEDGGDVFLRNVGVDFQRTARRYIREYSTVQQCLYLHRRASILWSLRVSNETYLHRNIHFSIFSRQSELRDGTMDAAIVSFIQVSFALVKLTLTVKNYNETVCLYPIWCSSCRLLWEAAVRSVIVCGEQRKTYANTSTYEHEDDVLISAGS